MILSRMLCPASGSSVGVSAVGKFSAAIFRCDRALIFTGGSICVFNQLVESRIRQIIQAAKKQQGQSLEATLQNLDRSEEGILGDLEQAEPVNRCLQLGGQLNVSARSQAVIGEAW